MGSQRVRHNWVMFTFTFFFPDSQNLLKLLINGNLSFYTCLAACTQSCSLYSHSFLHVYQIADVAVPGASLSTLYLSKFHPKWKSYQYKKSEGLLEAVVELRWRIHSWDFLGDPVVKNLPCNTGDSGLIPGQGTEVPHATWWLSPQPAATEACTPQLESLKCKRSCKAQLRPHEAK